MNRLFFAALFCAFILLVHLILGGQDVVDPLLSSNLATTPLLTLYVVWHITSLLLLASTIVYFFASRALSNSHSPPHSHWPFCARLLSYFYLALAALFLLIAFLHGGGTLYLELPQWLLFIPLAVLGLGSDKTKLRVLAATDPSP